MQLKNDAEPKYAEGLKFSTVEEPIVIPMVPWWWQILSFLTLQ